MGAVVGVIFLSLGLGALALLVRHDLRDFLLPDRLCAGLGASAVGFHASANWRYLAGPDAVLGAMTGAVALFALREFYRRRRGVEAIGLGDVKFMLAAGLWVGPWRVPLLLAIAALGTLATLGALRLAGAAPGVLGGARPVPFGPGLCVALVIVVADLLIGAPADAG